MKARAGKKKVILELGGNAGVIVDETADLAFAARRVAAGRLRVRRAELHLRAARLRPRACLRCVRRQLVARVAALRSATRSTRRPTSGR
jgi:hypothetical protein